MRNGKYGLYNGKMYALGKEQGDFINLVSRDNEDLKNGFSIKKNAPSYFIKEIKKDLLTKIVKITSVAIYRGEELQIIGEKDNQVILSTSNEKIAQKCNMEIVDRRDYKKLVNINEIKIIEKVQEL